MVGKSVNIAIGSFFAAGLIAGCAGDKQAAQTPPQMQMDPCSMTVMVNNGQAPKWITQKGAAFSGDKAVLYGVGNIAGTHNPALKRRAAEQAARADLASTLDTYVAKMQKQYLANVTAGDMDKASEEQHIQDVMKTLTEASLNGSDIVEYWEHPCTGHNESYALARLDMDRFMDIVAKMQSSNAKFKQLDAKVKQEILDHAKEAHADLNAELQKRQAAQQ